MYSGENKGMFPPGAVYRQSNLPYFTFHGGALYPEYWTDPNISICPSDSRAEGNIKFGVQEDYEAQINDLARKLPASQACLDYITSLSPSYLYLSQLCQSASQFTDLMDSRNTAIAQPGFDNFAITIPDHVGCFIGVVTHDLVEVKDLVGIHATIPTGLKDDDGVTNLPTSYPRLKEGIERFTITDINNPAAGARAQSNIVVMFDAWAENDPVQPTFIKGGTARFNHVPGGSNVLYMDGHVEFVKYGPKWPLRRPTDLPPIAAGYVSGFYFAIAGGFG